MLPSYYKLCKAPLQLYIAGVDSYVTIPLSSRSDVGQTWTIGVWVYFERFSDLDVIFCYQVKYFSKVNNEKIDTRQIN